MNGFYLPFWRLGTATPLFPRLSSITAFCMGNNSNRDCVCEVFKAISNIFMEQFSILWWNIIHTCTSTQQYQRTENCIMSTQIKFL